MGWWVWLDMVGWVWLDMGGWMWLDMVGWVWLDMGGWVSLDMGWWVWLDMGGWVWLDMVGHGWVMIAWMSVSGIGKYAHQVHYMHRRFPLLQTPSVLHSLYMHSCPLHTYKCSAD